MEGALVRRYEAHIGNMTGSYRFLGPGKRRHGVDRVIERCAPPSKNKGIRKAYQEVGLAFTTKDEWRSEVIGYHKGGVGAVGRAAEVRVPIPTTKVGG